MSRRLAWLFSASVAMAQPGLLACSHTSTVGDTEAKTNKEGQSSEEAVEAGKEAGKDDKAKRKAAAKEDKAATTKDDSPSGNASAPLSNSPAGLLKPDALEKIQSKLEANGQLDKDYSAGKFDPNTRTALRNFQEANGLPATGAPDDATVRKLGLNPSDIFRAK